MHSSSILDRATCKSFWISCKNKHLFLPFFFPDKKSNNVRIIEELHSMWCKCLHKERSDLILTLLSVGYCIFAWNSELILDQICYHVFWSTDFFIFIHGMEVCDVWFNMDRAYDINCLKGLHDQDYVLQNLPKCEEVRTESVYLFTSIHIFSMCLFPFFLFCLLFLFFSFIEYVPAFCSCF